ncbi:MAG: hypothetical protein AMJ43_02145 [Coxiella sp. DG_40]|nr:MAG: hypothetical protein AMJ43_02145 [Coxiella sp. DG_40]
MFYSSFKRSQVLREQIYTLDKCKKENDIFDIIINVIKIQHNFSILIKLIDDPIVRQYLFHDKLKSFWDDQLVDKQSLHDNFGLKHLNLKPHPIIPSLHLLIGHYFFNKYKRARQEEKEKFYFDKAIEYGCFEAILTSQNSDLDELSKNLKIERGVTLVERIVTNMTRLANLYATPGFIMFAQTCWNLTNYWANMDNEICAGASCELTLQNLYVANKLLLYSGTIISNVFGEQGLRNSNDFNIHDIPSAIKRLIKEEPGVFNVNTVVRIFDSANKIASKLIRLFSKEATQEQIDKYLAEQELAYYSQSSVSLELRVGW